ncbi:MAG: hypothetical protein IKL57_06795 [Oscillospiraceae bacterium]|nr:hypothetical protein [Oscillospiraceae bacterium]
MILYHGSNIFGIKTLEPRLADHERPYIYMSTLEIVAGFYMVNGVEKPYYWFPYGFGKDGIPEYDELYPDALREVSEGRRGCIYVVEAEEKDVIPFKNIPCARLATAAMEVKDCIEIPDCFEWLSEQEKKGVFRLRRFEDKSEKEMNWWHNRILSYIDEKNFIATPDCSYAEFVKLKFPEVWEKYEKICAERQKTEDLR